MNTQSFTAFKRFVLLLMLSFAAFFCFKTSAPSFAQNGEQREIENKIPEHLPIKIKFKKEKEEKIRDLKNDEWVRDFEMEVTNTSDKPIYFLDFFILFPDIVTGDGGTLGMPLRYGRLDFVKSSTRPVPEDVPIKPGETYVFKTPEKDQKGWYARKAAGYPRDPKKIQLIFAGLSFGDGTGFMGTTAVPYPHSKNQ